MDKIINPGSMPVWQGNAEVYCHIQYAKGKLSITGVVEPTRDGDCKGGCGQITDELASINVYASGWNDERIAYFATIWDRWHLNDMRPACEHQRTLGWGGNQLTLYHWRLNNDAHTLRKAAEKRALASLQTGEAFEPTKNEMAIIALPYKATTDSPTPPSPYYEPKTPLFKGDASRSVEQKLDGWTYPAEHPGGVLTKPCPVCGYKYGSAWLTEEVPPSVIEYLEGLPESTTTPAWI